MKVKRKYIEPKRNFEKIVVTMTIAEAQALVDRLGPSPYHSSTQPLYDGLIEALGGGV